MRWKAAARRQHSDPLGSMRPLRAAAFVTALVATATAAGQPPSHGKRSASRAPHGAVPTAATANPTAVMAYMAGRQPLVGWHAPSSHAIARDDAGQPMLSLATVNRGESLSIPAAGDDGGFAAIDLDRATHLLRAASGDEHPVDPRTLSLVYRIQRHFEVPEIRVVSGYRTPRPGSHSNHGKGRAMDIVVPGVVDEDVARFARDLGFVGVGVYPTSQFVHVDVRPRSYFWLDASGPHMRNRETGIMGDLAAKSDAAAIARGQPRVEPFIVGTDVDAALRARGAATTPAQDEDEDEDD